MLLDYKEATIEKDNSQFDESKRWLYDAEKRGLKLLMSVYVEKADTRHLTIRDSTITHSLAKGSDRASSAAGSMGGWNREPIEPLWSPILVSGSGEHDHMSLP